MTFTHRCPGPDCTTQVPTSKLACPRHWAQVPREVSAEVYAAYRAEPGSLRHVAAMDAAIAEMRA